MEKEPTMGVAIVFKIDLFNVMQLETTTRRREVMASCCMFIEQTAEEGDMLLTQK